MYCLDCAVKAWYTSNHPLFENPGFTPVYVKNFKSGICHCSFENSAYNAVSIKMFNLCLAPAVRNETTADS